MKKIKLLFKNHWQLLVIEAGIILIYGLASYYIDKNPVGNFTILSIIFSNEFFVAILVAIGAIYSWFASKADYEYNKNLEMLKDIDKIHDYYQDKDSFPDVVKSCQGHINETKPNKSGLAPFYRKTEAGLQPLDFFLSLRRSKTKSIILCF